MRRGGWKRPDHSARLRALPREERSRRALKGLARQSFEQRSAASKKGRATMTPERRSEAVRKAWATRRAKAEVAP